ncbi:MAG: hypothetical protein U0940_02655, partial [Nitrospirota bacterium]|nr:hypothetical protein [Nitrospirota bacterium]
TITLDIDGSRGELLEASGNLNVNIFNFFSVNGGFAFKKSTETVTLDTGDQVDVDLLTIGGSGINAFAGLNGGSVDALGLALSDTDFALVMAGDKLDTARKWTSLKATSGSVGFVGIDGLTVSADTLTVEVNRAGADKEGHLSVIDYKAQGLEVKTGPETTMTVDIDGKEGELIRATGNVYLNMFNFFAVEGSFGFEKKTETLKVVETKGTATTTDDVSRDVEMDLLTVGGAGITAFAGMSYKTADELGLKLTGVDFGLVLASEKKVEAGKTKGKWTSLKATAEEVSFAGIEGLTVRGTALEVEVNRASVDGSLLDYSDPLSVLTGPGQAMAIDLKASDGELIRAGGALEINLFNFFAVSGEFGFEKK